MKTTFDPVNDYMSHNFKVLTIILFGDSDLQISGDKLNYNEWSFFQDQHYPFCSIQDSRIT